MSSGHPAARHIPALDGLRGIAVAAVMLFHFAIAIDRHTPLWDGLRTLCGFGWSGVDLFFVLSGFLITGILLDSRSAPNYFSSFYVRRMLRIFPAYYTLLAILYCAAGLHPALAASLPPAADWRFYASYLQNWTVLLQQPGQMLVGHFWSLAIEEQFYLLWPFAVYFTSRRQLTFVALAGSLAAIVARNYLVHAGVEPETIYRNTFTRMDALLAGALVALAVRHPGVASWAAKRTAGLLLAAAAALATGPLLARSLRNTNFAMLSSGLSFVDAGYGLLLLAAATSGSRGALHRALSWTPLRSLGRYSYGLYLCHLPAYHLLIAIESLLRLPPGPCNIGLAALLTLTLSWISFQIIEQPFLKLKSRFSVQRSPRAAVPTVLSLAPNNRTGYPA